MLFRSDSVKGQANCSDERYLCFLGKQTRNNRSDIDCSQFDNDYDVLYHFSFPIVINPIEVDGNMSYAIG